MRYVGFSFFCLALLSGCNSSQPTPVATSPEPEISRRTIANPQYQSWEKFPIGTTILHRAITRQEGQKKETVTTVTYKLIESTPEQVTVEMQTKSTRFDGIETENPLRSFSYPAQLQVPDLPAKKADEKGEEKIRVGEWEYETTWRKAKDRNEAGDVFTQVWSSNSVPGGFVKSIMRTPAIGAITTTELIEVRQPETNRNK
jgi:hypothetical protein